MNILHFFCFFRSLLFVYSGEGVLDLDLDLDLDCLGERDLERDDDRELDLDDTDDFDLFLSSLPFKGSVLTSFLQNKLDLSICIYCN